MNTKGLTGLLVFVLISILGHVGAGFDSSLALQSGSKVPSPFQSVELAQQVDLLPDPIYDNYLAMRLISSPDSSTFAVFYRDLQYNSSDPAIVQVWNINDLSDGWTLTLDERDAEGIALSANGEYLAVQYVSGEVVLWNVGIEEPIMRVPNAGVPRFSSDSQYFAYASPAIGLPSSGEESQPFIHVFDLTQRTHTEQYAIGSPVFDMQFQPNSLRIVATDVRDSSIWLVDLQRGTREASRLFDILGRTVFEIYLPFADDRVTVGLSSGELQVFELSSGREIYTSSCLRRPRSPEFPEPYTSLFVLCADENTQLLDATRLDLYPFGYAEYWGVSQSGSLVLATSSDTVIALYSVIETAELSRLAVESPIASAHFINSDEHILVLSFSGILNVFSIS